MNGLFASIVEITNGKCLLSLLVAAPSQITMNTTLAPMIDVRTGQQEHQREWDVDLAAGGQEDHLVAQAEHGQALPRIASVCQRGSTPTALSNTGIGPLPSETSATTRSTSSAA